MTTTKELIEALVLKHAAPWSIGTSCGSSPTSINELAGAEANDIAKAVRDTASYLQSPAFLRTYYEERIAELEIRNSDVRKAIYSQLPDGAIFYDLAAEHRENSHLIQAYLILTQRLEATK